MGSFGSRCVALCSALLCAPAAGQVNRALSFGPGGVVQVPSSPSLDSILSALTIEAWVRLDGSSIYPTILARALAIGPNAGEVFVLRVAGGVPTGGTMPFAFSLRVGPDFFGNYNTFLLLADVPQAYIDWHHAAATFDGVTMRLYWDGALAASAVHPGSIAPTTTPVFLGTGSGTDTWIGRIDEARLWNVARSAAQIQSFRYSPMVGNEPGLVAYWRFDEGSGQFAFDSTPNGNHGILGNLPIPDPADPVWVATAAPLGAFVGSVSPSFGPFYLSTPVTVTGQGFTPGMSALSVGGQVVTGATVVDGGTITAVVPPAPAGPASVSVSSLYGPGDLPGGWTWAGHLHATGGISATVGGTVNLSLFGEPSNALRLYLVATSLSGTSPGIPLPGSSLVLPLNPDPWMQLGLQQLNSSTFASFFGVLNAQGTGSASFNLGAIPVVPAPIGLQIRFAYVVFQSLGGGFALASNPVTVTVTP